MKTNKESGVISIFTVLMFMVFISVITIGFIKIVTDEQRQAVDNDLSASAYASARSGVEEGKRILLLCQTPNATQAAACATILNNPSCTAVTSVAAATVVQSDLGINLDPATREGVVADNRFQQRWTCMTISTRTDYIERTVESATAATPGKGALIPLRSNQPFSTVRFSWHNTAKNGVAALRGSTTRISQPEWTAGNYPAAMRVELIAYPKGSINLNTLDADTRTLVLFPTSFTPSSPPTLVNFTSDGRSGDPNTRIAPVPAAIRCNTASNYVCTADLSLAGLTPNSTTHDFYIKVSAYYRDADINVELRNAAGLAQFDGVEPFVDVTGRTDDVFRRVRASVSLDSTGYLPNFAIESGQSFCKDMLVADTDDNSSDFCDAP